MKNEFDNMSQSQKILNAAFKCISSKGYANVSLRDIANEAGVVLSQLNYYYKNKEGLFTEVVKKLAEQYLNEIEDIFKKGIAEKKKLSCLVEYFQEMLRKKPELLKLLFDLISMSFWSASLKKILSNFFNDVTQLIEKYIDNFSNKEEFKNYSPATLSRMISGALFGTSVQVILAHGEDDMIDSLSAIQALFQ